MALLLITYDLGKQGTDYPNLLSTIDRYSNIRITESSFAIITDESPQKVCSEMKKFIGDGNTIYVITLKKPYDSSNLNYTSDWLMKVLTD